MPTNRTRPTMGPDDEGVPRHAGGTTHVSDQPASRVPVSELARRQRLLVYVAGGLATAALLGAIGLGHWLAGVLLAVGVGLALANLILTELAMVRMTATDGELSRRRFALGALMRLSAVSLVAFALVVVFWPVGGLVLVGLAVFQLLSVGITSLPLLKELRHS